jgi:hypothetical protein
MGKVPYQASVIFLQIFQDRLGVLAGQLGP